MTSLRLVLTMPTVFLYLLYSVLLQESGWFSLSYDMVPLGVLSTCAAINSDWELVQQTRGGELWMERKWLKEAIDISIMFILSSLFL